MRLWRASLAIPLALALSFAQSNPVAAASYTLFGDATVVHPGHNSDTAVQLRSINVSNGGIDFAMPSDGSLSALTTLSSDYMFTAGSCGGGAPRFQINVMQGGVERNIFVYFGTPPNYNDCVLNTWVSTGDLLTDAALVDATQLGGSFYDTWANVLAQFGDLPVTGIQLVTDGGWTQSGLAQTVLVDNVTINDMVFTFEEEPTKESCKNGGWKSFTDDPGPFKNQGDCVSFFATGGKNEADGD